MKPTLFALLTILPLSAFCQEADTTPPQIVALAFSPSAVNVSAAPQNVTVTATITDDLSGISGQGFAYVYFTSPTQGQTFYAFLSRTSGTPLNGNYQGTAAFPRFVEAGIWKAQAFLEDAAGNSVTLTTAQLSAMGFPTTLTVTDATPDTLPPTLVSASFSPASIDVSNAAMPVLLSLQVTDNLSGAFNNGITWLAVTLQPAAASGSDAVEYIDSNSFHLVAGTPQNGAWQATKLMPRYSPAGAWQISKVRLYDQVGNSISLTTAQLQAAGINPVLTVTSSPSDTSPPKLQNLTFSPPLFNTSAGSQNVTITLSATDDLSGVDFTPTTPTIAFYQIFFSSPSGNQSVGVNPFTAPTLQAGTPQAGTWTLTASWPQFSEEGTWTLSLLSLKDSAGNIMSYTPAMLTAMGISSSIVVTKPSLTVDGTVGPAGGTVVDNSFGSRAELTFPPGVVSNSTAVSIDVFASPLAVPTPRGFTMPASYFVNLSFNPPLPTPLPAPGITVVLPLPTPMTPGANLSLFHIDPTTGMLAPAMNAFHSLAVGTVDAGGLSATFQNIVTLSTVVAYLSNGSVPGDVNGDGVVNCQDVTLVTASFGKRTGQPGFNLAADLNNDGVVNILDLVLVTHQLPAGMACH